jgi:hypothetical protein
VASRHELRDELSAEGAGGAGDEDLLSSHLPLRRDRDPACDSGGASLRGLALGGVEPAAGGESHERGVEVDVGGAALALFIAIERFGPHAL